MASVRRAADASSNAARSSADRASSEEAATPPRSRAASAVLRQPSGNSSSRSSGRAGPGHGLTNRCRYPSSGLVRSASASSASGSSAGQTVSAALARPLEQLDQEPPDALGHQVLAVPVGRRDEQVLLRAGERHVAGAALLGDLLFAQGVGERLHVVVEARQQVAIAPELDVERAPLACRVLLHARVREQAVGEPRDEHRLELESLGRVHRHHLHRVVVARLDRVPLAVVVDRVQMLEERPGA